MLASTGAKPPGRRIGGHRSQAWPPSLRPGTVSHMARGLVLLTIFLLAACSGASSSDAHDADSSTDLDSGSESHGDAGVGGDGGTGGTRAGDSGDGRIGGTDAGGGGDGGTGGTDAGGGAQRHVYSGTLDAAGNATLSVPEIALGSMPLVLGYVFSSVYAEPGYVLLGNIIPSDGTFRFAAGAGNANAEYRLVVLDAERVETGTLDANGNATLSVPEISVSDMPLVVGYVLSSAYAEPGYVALGNIIPGDGSFRFAAGSGNANAPFILVIATPAGHAAGSLDADGNATQAIASIDLSDPPAVLGHVFTSAYAEPGYVMLGNILPADRTFRFAAGAGNAAAPFIITWTH